MVQGVRYLVWRIGNRVWDNTVQSLQFRIKGLVIRVWNVGCRFQGSGFRGYDLG